MFDFGLGLLMQAIGLYKTAKEVKGVVRDVFNPAEERHTTDCGVPDAGHGISQFDFPPVQNKRKHKPNADEKDERGSLLEELAKGSFLEPNYYAQISKRVAQTARRNSAAAAESSILERLNSEELPRSYALIEHRLADLGALTGEAEFLQSPPKKPDTRKLNYMSDGRKIAVGYARFLQGRIRLMTRGSKRTLDVVLDEIVQAVGLLQKDVDVAISHSSRIIDGLAAYQEEVIETRIREAAHDWGKEFNSGANAKDLIERVGQYKPGSGPEDYSRLSTAERNLERALQHASARMMDAEAVAVHNKAAMQTANSLEGNLRTGLLELERFSTLLAQEVQDTNYTAQGSRLLKHGYRNAQAIGTAAATLRSVVNIRLKEINASIGSFKANLKVAQQCVVAEDKGYIQPPEVATGVGYAKTREEAIKLFSQMGVKEAKAVYAFGTDAK